MSLDTSRAVTSELIKSDTLLREEVDAYVQATFQLQGEGWMSHHNGDSICEQIMTYLQEGWPSKSSMHKPVKPFYTVCSELLMQNGLLTRDSCLIILTDLQLLFTCY